MTAAQRRSSLTISAEKGKAVVFALWRFFRRLVFTALILLLSVAASAWLLASFSLPKMAGEETLAGLDARVEVVRDAHGIPRIFAKSARDAYFAMGYVHATDRLWQMDVTRRVAQGRLSERFGTRALSTDRLMRALDLDGHAARSVSALSDEARSVLESYADGVNARITQVAELGLGHGAPEFYVFGDTIDPWSPADSLSVLKVMAFQISRSALAREVKRGRFLLALEPGQLRDLYPDDPGAAVTGLPRRAVPVPEQAESDVPDDADDPMPVLGNLTDEEGGGSNVWAVSGEHTSSRAPLLANDPHLPLTAPAVWHPVQISWPGVDRIGATLAGVPAILIGHNARIAWGLTAAQIDDLDVFIERLDPDDPSRVYRKDGWETLETREEQIALRSGSPVGYLRRESRHGPVLPIGVAGLAAVTPRDHVPALSWTALADDDTSFEALLRLNRAESATEGLRAAELHVAPALNLVVADRRVIGMTLAGRVPLRRLTSKIQGRVPSPGWEDAHDWVGMLPRSALPTSINPASGAVANANNRVANAPFPRHLSFDWDAPYRINRIVKLLESRETHSVESFRAMQVDTVSEMARTIAPLIGEALWRGEAAENAHPLRRPALERLRSWNGAMSEREASPLIFAAWTDRLTRLLVEDELDELASQYSGPRPLFLERVFRDLEGASRWCDDIRTEDVAESCAGMAARALDEALEALQERYGDDVERWRWGKAHPAMHNHPALGEVGFSAFGVELSLSRIVNIEHETPGGNYTLNRGASTFMGEMPFANVHAAGFRAVYDLADLDRSLFIVSTGASGHFLSPLYRNLAPLWRAGELVSMSAARADVEPGAMGRLVLSPPQTPGGEILP